MPAIQNNKSTLKWIESLGTSDRGDQVSLNHVAQALVELAEFLIAKAENNLDKNGNRATGKTASSMQITNLQTNARKMSLDVEIASTYKFLNDGVRGTESGQGKYKFRSKYPNKKMAMALKDWIKVRRIVTKYKPISKTEEKNKKVQASASGKTDKQITGLAYAIATNIKKKGIKPTYFFSGKNYSAVEATKKEQQKRFAKAFKLDIIENLNKN